MLQNNVSEKWDMLKPDGNTLLVLNKESKKSAT